jgi:hypothetical protein
MVIVCADMLMVIFYWMALVCVKPFVDLTENEVINKNFFASDFTLQLTQQPYSDRIEDIAAIQWQWAERILQRDNVKQVNPETNMLDEN